MGRKLGGAVSRSNQWKDFSSMVEHDQTERPDLRTAEGLLRRRYAVMLPFLLIPIAALLFSLHQEKQYSASASVVFSEGDNISSDDPAREAATNVALLTDDQIKRGVARRLGRGHPPAEKVKAAQEGQANVLRITATDSDPRRAAATANAYAAQYVANRRTAARGKILDQQRFVRQELARLPRTAATRAGRLSLQERLRRLQYNVSQEDGGAQVIATATPPTVPTSPKTVRNTVIGAIVAIVLAVLAAVLFERLDPRLTTPREVAATVGRPILGFIRKSRALRRGSPTSRPPPDDADDFTALRARLRYARADQAVRSVLITSSTEGDGKTTIAWNLARAATGPGSKVLFVEADLRNPTIARALGADPELSLARVLKGGASLPDVIQEIAFPSVRNGGPSPVVSVALAGGAPTRSTDTLAWERLGAEVHDAERDFDLIVIDTPPILSVPDAIPLVSQVDGVLVVGRLGRTPRAALARLTEQLEAIGAPTLGVVVNSVGKDAMYGYGYGYR
jgi:capsular exopolysaccharide synthesis family protein